MENQTMFEHRELLAPHFGIFKRIAINHAHPTKALFDAIGFIWMTYFLWHNKIVPAIVIGFGFSFLGSVLAWHADTERLTHTAFGKYVIARLQPKSLFFQSLGFFVVLYGTWMHETPVILAGVSSVLFGHLWTWTKKPVP